jgi:hypothetical protein
VFPLDDSRVSRFFGVKAKLHAGPDRVHLLQVSPEEKAAAEKKPCDRQ